MRFARSAATLLSGLFVLTMAVAVFGARSPAAGPKAMVLARPDDGGAASRQILVKSLEAQDGRGRGSDDEAAPSRQLLVGTLDGALQAYDAQSGALLWRHSGLGGLLEEIYRPERSAAQFFVAPHDGSIVLVSGEEAEIIGTIPDIVDQNINRKGNFRFLGAKASIWVELNARTGAVCGADSVTADHPPTGGGADGRRSRCTGEVIQLAQTKYSLKISDYETGEVFWNGTFRPYTIMPQLSSGAPHKVAHDFPSSLGSGELISAHAGQNSLTFIPDKADGGVEWQKELESPIFYSFLMTEDRVEAIDLGRNYLTTSDIPLVGCDTTPVDQGTTALDVRRRPDGSSASKKPDTVPGQHIVRFVKNEDTIFARFLAPNEVPLLPGPAGLTHVASSGDSDTGNSSGGDGDDTYNDGDEDLYIEHGAGDDAPDVDRVFSIDQMLHHDIIAAPLLPDGPALLPDASDSASSSPPPGSRRVQLMSVLLSVVLVCITAAAMFYWNRQAQRKAQTLQEQQLKEQLALAEAEAALAARKLSVDYDAILGCGSLGTIVYQGLYEGRQVAVKRMLREHFDVAHREVELLRQSDDHQNVVRYFCMEEDKQFLYIGLELCQATLELVIQAPPSETPLSYETFSEADRRLLGLDFMSGLAHLHGLNIVHRDVKPQNVLISLKGSRFVAMLSDFGLCVKLPDGELSRHTTCIGTVGWAAPEMLIHGRMTKGGDMFSAGCVLHYLATRQHPYGEVFERELHIRKGTPRLCQHSPLFDDLVSKLLCPNPEDRLPAARACHHPFFWDAGRRLRFLMDVSDRIEKEPPTSPLIVALEANSKKVLGTSWLARIGTDLANDLGKFRKYRPTSVMDLMRAVRNKKHHYMELPENVKNSLGSLPDGFLDYFESRFPHLFLNAYNMVDQLCRSEDLFVDYFE